MFSLKCGVPCQPIRDSVVVTWGSVRRSVIIAGAVGEVVRRYPSGPQHRDGAVHACEQDWIECELPFAPADQSRDVPLTS